MSLSTQPYKGARDFYPEDKRLQKYMFAKAKEVVEKFGYQEYDAPVLEPLELYQAKTGDEIVNEQTYAFEDRGGRQVALRPEMTPSVSRLVAGRRQELAYPLRLYNVGPRWRYERPQRGRNREFWQLDVDLFGVTGIEGDTEIIQIADAVLKSFGASDGQYEIHINSRSHLNSQLDSLELTAEQREKTLRLLDKQTKIDPDEFESLFKELLGGQKAAELLSALKDNQPPPKASQLVELLKNSGVNGVVYDGGIVRGLEYYTDIVFEVFDTNPENNRSLFGGGRYDGLVGLFGVEAVPTVGFAVGDVTLQNFLESHDLLPKLGPETDAVAILVGDVYGRSQDALSQLRKAGVRAAVDSTDRKLDAKIKSAAKSGVRYAVFIGEKELDSGRFTLRDLHDGNEQNLSLEQIAQTLAAARG